MSHKEGQSRQTPSQPGIPISSLSLPNTSPARQNLGSKKKSDSKNVHPGYSMFDWHKVCNSEQDMTRTGGKLLKVTRQELAKHCRDNDVWTAVRGVVYNISLFAKYHPGGKPQLMRGAGNDCTELFDKVHVWVNSEAILEKCIVGYLVGTKPPQKQTSLAVSVTKPPFPGGSADRDSLGEDVLSLNVPSLGGVASGSGGGGNMEEEGTQDEVIASDDSYPTTFSISVPTATTGISIPVPTADVLTTGISIPVPTVTIGISLPDDTSISVPTAATGISIPVPTADVLTTVPVPTSNISISAPSTDIPTAGISIPVPTSFTSSSSLSGNSLYKPIPFLPAKQHITNHPLISKTAYETAV